MDNSISILSQHITPTTAGIFWFTDTPLDYKSSGVYEFNYLLDGLVVKALEENVERNNKSNYFLGENFGNPFFIGHVVVENKSDFHTVYSHYQVAQSFIQENSTIYIYNKSKNTANINILKELKAKYPLVEFKNLNI